jgi:hypothetical protein
MERYLRTVTLVACTWQHEKRVARRFEHIGKCGYAWLFLHFLLITICLNFPVTYNIARLSPFEFYSRLYGENVSSVIPDAGHPAWQDALQEALAENHDIFNQLMYENEFGKNVLLPFLGIAFLLTLVIQIAFYLCAVFFLKIARMHYTPLSLRNRLGLALFSSTLPVLAAAVFGMFLPTVHIIIFYFAVIFFVFQRSNKYRWRD